MFPPKNSGRVAREMPARLFSHGKLPEFSPTSVEANISAALLGMQATRLPLDKRFRVSRLLFLAEFLESGIGAQRVPQRVESKKGLCNG